MKDWKFHCAVLGIKEDASLKEVKKAYHLLALERHPDKHNGSQQAHEDFQQLNESYRYIVAGLANGGPPAEKPATAPAPQPRMAPQARTLPPPRNFFRKPWLHAGLACLALLILSVFLDTTEKRSQPVERELFPQLAEPQPVMPPPPAAPPEVPLATCEIAVEKIVGASTSAYRTPNEGSCQMVCAAMMREKTREGIRCSWNGTEFRRQLAAAPASEPAAAPVAKAEPEKNTRFQPPVVNEPRDTCFMSVVGEDGSFADSFPDETQDSCKKRCVHEVYAHPTGKEIKCSFAGILLINFIPDPMLSYLARDPASSGFYQNGEFLSTCEVQLKVGKKKPLFLAEVRSIQVCRKTCEHLLLQTPKGTEVTCSFNGEQFLQEQSSN